MARYWVIAEEICPDCGGYGAYRNPDWAEFTRFRGPFYTLREAAEWFGVPEDALPPEELPCPTCKGGGSVRYEIDLAEALRRLRIGEK